jgi:hypothetical protein
MMTIVANPRQYKIPDWFLNRQRDIKDGRFTQITSSGLETKLRDDLERLKKIRWGAVTGVFTGVVWGCAAALGRIARWGQRLPHLLLQACKPSSTHR